MTVHRVVNIVDKRNSMPRPGFDYDRGFDEDQWYGGSHNYHDDREYLEGYDYPSNDRRYHEDNIHPGSFRRHSPPPRNDAPYPQHGYGRDDLRHQLGSRSSGRARPYFRNKGPGPGPPQREDMGNYRSSPPASMKRDRSPRRRESIQPPVRSGSNSSRRSFSPERDKNYIQRHKPNVSSSSNIPSSNTTSRNVSSSITASSVEEEEEEASISLRSSEEQTPASVAETEKVVTASMEPEPELDEDLKARRLEAIKAKALEIEKHYRQDCETFRTVVKMLVSKEPSLDNLLQAPLDKNLLEMKQRCLDSLKHFVKELDEVLQQPDTSPEDMGLKTLN